MSEKDVPTDTGFGGCLIRLIWMVFGNFVLVVCLYGIVQRPRQIFGIVDAIYMATVVAVIALRYIDIRHYAGTKSTGEPATLADWRRYSWLVVGVAGAAWCLVRGYAWFIATR
jgi:hypothetical protein